MQATYDISVERGERHWLIYAPAVERSTQARHLREVDAIARDLIAVMLDIDPNSFTVRVNHVTAN